MQQERSSFLNTRMNIFVFIEEICHNVSCLLSTVMTLLQLQSILATCVCIERENVHHSFTNNATPYNNKF